MKVTVSESDAWRRTLEVEVPGEDVRRRFETAYKNYSKSLNLPGFRKGKIPVGLVKKRFGKAIQGEVLQEVMQECYREASRSEGLTPISEATIEDVNYEEGQPLKFTASVDVKPEIVAQDYRGLKTTRPVFKVTDADVEEQLQRVQEQNATEQEVDRPAGLGDVVVADLQELDESGLPIIGRKQEERPFHIGGRNANHDLDNQLMGISAGETRRIVLTHTGEDENEAHTEGSQHQEGREVRMMFSAKEIRERTLPELDDEFAKDQGQFESLDELTAQIRTDLQAQADFASRRYLEGHIVDELIRKNAFDLPEVMIENALDTLVENQKKEHEGHDHDIDEDAIRQEGREGTIRGLKRHILMEAIQKQEELEVEEAEMDSQLDVMSRRYNTERAQLRQILKRSDQIERIESNLLTEKTFDFLIEHAEVEDVEAK
ncbi:MAG: trigger factor [Gemmatimonadetes bacterium]|nr:trigger factor [Gemmatimonadota bacterium]